MSAISKRKLCGEDFESVAGPLMAAVNRSLDPKSEWFNLRDSLHEVIRNLPLASFDESAQSLLRRLGIIHCAEATSSTPLSPDAGEDAGEDAGDDAGEDADMGRFIPVPKLSGRHRKAFRCKSCQFTWVERVSVLTKRDQRVRRCLCADPVLPHKYFCTRNAKVDLKNIQALLKHQTRSCRDWRVDTTVDEFKNSRITIRLKHKRTDRVQTVVLRPLLAGSTQLY